MSRFDRVGISLWTMQSTAARPGLGRALYRRFREDVLVAEELGRGSPRELLVREEDKDEPWVQRLRSALSGNVALATLDRSAFEPKRAQAYLQNHFAVASLDGFGLAKAPLATGAAGAALGSAANESGANERRAPSRAQRRRAKGLREGFMRP